MKIKCKNPIKLWQYIQDFRGNIKVVEIEEEEGVMESVTIENISTQAKKH